MKVIQSTQYALCLSIIGSLAIAPGVFAQIPVTGGRITGDAGFFVPDSGNTTLFDAATRTLRLETPNGVTVDSRVIPTVGVLNPIGNRLPVAGDRGSLGGFLSGRGFDSAGNPVPFSGVPTTLNFTVNSFTPDIGFLEGTLITPTVPGTASPIFLPVLGATLSPASDISFDANNGTIYGGSFDANLPSGLINLPRTIRFGTPDNVTEFDFPDTVRLTDPLTNFAISGRGTPTAKSFINPTTGDIFYDSLDAVVDFRIDIQGTPLKIEGSGRSGATIAISNSLGIFSSDPCGCFTGFVGPVNFSVIGNGSGSATNFSPQQFRSKYSDTEFFFQDDLGHFIRGSSSDSRVSFDIFGTFAFTTSSFTGIVPDPSLNTADLSNDGIFIPAPVIPPPSLVGNGSPTPGLGGGTGNTGGNTGNTGGNTGNTGGNTGTTGGNTNVRTITVSLPQIRNSSTTQVIQVGPPSRVFPGIGDVVVVASTQPSDRSEIVPQPTENSNGQRGRSQQNPILPVVIVIGIFQFPNVPSGNWFDPPLASGYEYEMTSDSLFTKISGFPKDIDADNRFTVSVGGKVLGEFGPGETLNFADYKDILGDLLVNGEGVSKFTISAIDPAVDASDPAAFPVKLEFNTERASFDMRSLDPDKTNTSDNRVESDSDRTQEVSTYPDGEENKILKGNSDLISANQYSTTKTR